MFSVKAGVYFQNNFSCIFNYPKYMILWWKFCQNMFSGLDDKAGHRRTYIDLKTVIKKHIFDFRRPQNGYFHQKPKIVICTTRQIFFNNSPCEKVQNFKQMVSFQNTVHLMWTQQLFLLFKFIRTSYNPNFFISKICRKRAQIRSHRMLLSFINVYQQIINQFHLKRTKHTMLLYTNGCKER